VQHKLTITLDEDVYQALQKPVGRGHISCFIEDLVRPHVLTRQDSEDGYRAMAADTEQEAEAKEWVEGLIGESLERIHPMCSLVVAGGIG
jgi:predicted CopG family antitoxin